MVAQKIQDSMSSSNDLNAQQRESYLAADRIIASFSMPMVAAVDAYARCRRMLGEVPLMSAEPVFQQPVSPTNRDGSALPFCECLEFQIEQEPVLAVRAQGDGRDGPCQVAPPTRALPQRPSYHKGTHGLLFMGLDGNLAFAAADLARSGCRRGGFLAAGHSERAGFYRERGDFADGFLLQ